MKNILLVALIAPALHAMEPAEKRIKLIVGNQVFAVPQSAALQAQTLKHMADDLGITHDIELSEKISLPAMRHIAQIMWRFEDYKNLKNKALLDAIQAVVHLTGPRLDLLQAFNYLDFPVGLELVARGIAKDQSILKQFIADKSLKDLRPLVAKYYYLVHGKNLEVVDEHGKNIVDVDEKSYGFSIQEYLDYQSQMISSKRSRESYMMLFLDFLNLSNMRLNSLEGLDTIAGLTDLERLDLNNNQLSVLPAGTFNGLPNLQWLYLENNQLSSLPAGTFNGLANLQELDLENNQLSVLPAGTFNGLANLIVLHLENNQLSSLPAGTFNSLSNLQELDLENNQLSVLPAGTFNGLAHLEVLQLDHNQLSALPVGVFNELANLERLFLENNQLSMLPTGIFNGLANLERLDLTYNQLSGLRIEIFNGLTNLREIFLYNNKLNEENKKKLRDALPGLNISF